MDKMKATAEAEVVQKKAEIEAVDDALERQMKRQRVQHEISLEREKLEIEKAKLELKKEVARKQANAARATALLLEHKF